MHIPSITTIPTIPTAFFTIDVAPITISTLSPSVFPTTGIRFDTDFIPFAASPSTLLESVPSKDNILINIVTTVTNIQATPDFKNLDNFSILTLSDKLDTTDITVAINVIGNINKVIVFAIKTIKKSIIGSKSDIVATFPRS